MVRRLCVDALEKIHRSPVPVREAVNALLRKHPRTPENQAFLWEVVHGVTRLRDVIDRILTAHSRVKLKKVHPRVLQALRIAVYQIVWLDRIPPSAAVYESVQIVKRTFPDWVVKFANGCLRGVTRGLEMKIAGALTREQLRRAVPISGCRHCLFEKDLFPDPEEESVAALAARHAHPEWLVRRWADTYGEEETESILRAGNEPPSLWLRASPGRRADLSRELGRRGIRHETEAEPAPGAVRLLGPHGPVSELPGYERGWFVVQDRTAMRAAALLAPEPGERVLDLCAAPGGKATHLAHLVGPEGSVVAVDRKAGGVRRLEQTAKRLGLANVSTVVADVCEESLDLGGEPFGKVLVDVPCSNTGVLARRVEVRHRLAEESLAELAAAQRTLLTAACARVRPGGVLVYSTCALTEEENRGVVDGAIEAGAPLEIEEERESLPRPGACDGGYVVRLRKL